LPGNRGSRSSFFGLLSAISGGQFILFPSGLFLNGCLWPDSSHDHAHPPVPAAVGRLHPLLSGSFLAQFLTFNVTIFLTSTEDHRIFN
jgi:hypothetical protein